MIKMARDTRRSLKPKHTSLSVRPKLALVFGFLATAIVILAVLSWLQKNEVDEARSAEVILNQIAVLTREINNLTLTVLHEPEAYP